MEPVLSVIIPVYNAERTLRTAIDSVIMQRCDDVEIVVVDDGSTDGSWEIIESYGDRIVALRQENAGANVARNHGARVSRGRFLKFLDSDDFLFPEALGKQIEHAEGLPENAFSCGDRWLWAEQSNEPYFVPLIESIRGNGRKKRDPIRGSHHISTLIFPRSMFNSIGGFDESLAVYQDIIIYIKGVLMGYDPVSFPLIVSVYRQHTSVHRVSRNSSADDMASVLAEYRKLALILDGTTSSYPKGALARSLAQRVWWAGRKSTRFGHIDIAEQLFSLARDIDKRCATGYPPYRTFVAIFGPIRAESIWITLRACIARALRL